MGAPSDATLVDPAVPDPGAAAAPRLPLPLERDDGVAARRRHHDDRARVAGVRALERADRARGDRCRADDPACAAPARGRRGQRSVRAAQGADRGRHGAHARGVRARRPRGERPHPDLAHDADRGLLRRGQRVLRSRVRRSRAGSRARGRARAGEFARPVRPPRRVPHARAGMRRMDHRDVRRSGRPRVLRRRGHVPRVRRRACSRSAVARHRAPRSARTATPSRSGRRSPKGCATCARGCGCGARSSRRRSRT